MITLYLVGFGCFWFGFLTCALFSKHKENEAALPYNAFKALDIGESYRNLRDGRMTEIDEANLRDLSHFERDERDRTYSEIDLEIIENDVNRAVRRG